MWNGIEELEKDVLPDFTLKGSSLGEIIGIILPFLFAVTGAVLLIYLVWGGISLILSLGEPKAVALARGRITNALLGALIIAFAYLIVQMIAKILGLDNFGGLFNP